MNKTPVLLLKDIVKSYKDKKKSLEILHGISLSAQAGEVIAILGPSGAGKSTLLHIAGLLDDVTTGEVWIKGERCNSLKSDKKAMKRGKEIGFIYQFHHLLPDFTALENVAMPMFLQDYDHTEARKRAEKLLDRVGLSHRLTHFPSELSGGEQQRVAIARALANSPSLLLADEPTGNLDTENSHAVFSLIKELAAQENLCSLIVTHNPELAKECQRIIHMENGHLISDKTNKIANAHH